MGIRVWIDLAVLIGRFDSFSPNEFNVLVLWR